MAKGKKTTHVRAFVEKKERAQEVARRMAVKLRRAVPYGSVIDECLEDGLTKRERQLGIVSGKSRVAIV